VFNWSTIIMLTSLDFCMMNYERILIYTEVNTIQYNIIFLFILK